MVATDPQKLHMRARWWSQSSTLESNTGPSSASARALS